MTAIPLELPMKASEAAALADLIYQHAEGRPLNDELRTRLAGRASTLGLSSVLPHARSLQRDPVHLSTYYVAVDSKKGDRVNPWMLRIALASAPASGLFPMAVLIGRMRPGGGREIVVNAIPFSAADGVAVRTFAEKVDPATLPRPQGAQSSIVAGSRIPSLTVPAAFEAFRTVLKNTGANLASPVQLSGYELLDAEGPDDANPLAAGFTRVPLQELYQAGLWGAIRAGWRDGYSAEAGPFAIPGGASTAPAVIALKKLLANAGGFTKFSIDTSAIQGVPHNTRVVELDGFPEDEADQRTREFGRGLEIAEEIFDTIRQAKAASGTGRTFDFELSLADCQYFTTPRQLHFVLEWMRSRGRPLQMVAPNVGFREGQPYLGPLEELRDRIIDLAAVARNFNVTLSFPGGSGMT